MGFSHHWSNKTFIPNGEWTAICESTAFLIEAFGHPLVTGQALPSLGSIYIDAGQYGCEHFRLQRSVVRLDFCKTEHTPYDVLICAILGVAAATWPALEVTSDGDLTHWHARMTWAGAVLGRDIPVPRGILPSDEPE
jgi:hypothetical protein